MSLYLVTAPTIEPITLPEAKAQCRVDTSDEDALIAGLISAARQYAETYTHRALVTQTWDLKYDWFPCGPIELPLPPAVSVTSITYLDTAGASQTWSSANYLTEFPVGPKASHARLTPAYGVSYPSTYSVMNAVTVRFVCGYGSTAALALAAIPASIKAGIKLLVSHWYEQRTPVNVGNLVSPIPTTVDALLWPYKAF